MLLVLILPYSYFIQAANDNNFDTEDNAENENDGIVGEPKHYNNKSYKTAPHSSSYLYEEPTLKRKGTYIVCKTPQDEAKAGRRSLLDKFCCTCCWIPSQDHVINYEIHNKDEEMQKMI